MPREIALLGVYMPTLLPLLAATAAVHWSLDSLLARVGFYRLVWHPSLFRLSTFIGIYAAAGLYLYR